MAPTGGASVWVWFSLASPDNVLACFVIRLLFSIFAVCGTKLFAETTILVPTMPPASPCFSRRILPVYAFGGKSVSACNPVPRGFARSPETVRHAGLSAGPDSGPVAADRFMIFP
jgi:hypothetical protein